MPKHKLPSYAISVSKIPDEGIIACNLHTLGAFADGARLPYIAIKCRCDTPHLRLTQDDGRTLTLWMRSVLQLSAQVVVAAQAQSRAQAPNIRTISLPLEDLESKAGSKSFERMIFHGTGPNQRHFLRLCAFWRDIGTEYYIGREMLFSMCPAEST